MSNNYPTTYKISARDFYSEFRGHRVEHLEQLVYHLRNNHDEIQNRNNNHASTGTCSTNGNTIQVDPKPVTNTNIIWTAGDSSLDNKYWFHDTVPALPSYQSILRPPISKPDVTYWLNYILSNTSNNNSQVSVSSSVITSSQKETSKDSTQSPNHRYIAVNGAVEASTLNIRSFKLLPQDEFIRDHIQEDDILIVSIGGNDVALVPQPCTIVSLLCLILVLPTICIEKGCIYGTIPMDDYCCSCGPSFLSCCCACPPCLGYLRHLFGYRLQHYIQRITSKTKPSKIVVCMIYYPDEQPDVNTWANHTLQILGYNTNPSKVQALIRKIYTEVITTISIPGSEMIYIPLYHILNGQQTEDYVARVEPSVIGGRKMAEYIYASIFPNHNVTSSPSSYQYTPTTATTTPTSPSSARMQRS
jgi:hypothetical protein